MVSHGGLAWRGYPRDATESLENEKKNPNPTSCRKTAVGNILRIHYAGAEGLQTQHVMSKRFKAFTPRRLADESCKEERNLTESARNDVLPPTFCFQAVSTETLAQKELPT